jgi:lipopolysaccharide export system ATP-binding protein
VGLLGPNGAGKTTVFSIIMGLIKPDRGNVRLDGQIITDLPLFQRGRLGMGYLPQEPSIFRGLSVAGNILAVLESHVRGRGERQARLKSLLEEFGLTDLAHTDALALSGGERRRCEIARAMAGEPIFMLLDEPFAGVDPIAVAEVKGLVRHLTQRGVGVLITDHSVRETLSLVDRAYLIHGGRVMIQGKPEVITADPEARRVYLGDSFSV